MRTQDTTRLTYEWRAEYEDGFWFVDGDDVPEDLVPLCRDLSDKQGEVRLQFDLEVTETSDYRHGIYVENAVNDWSAEVEITGLRINGEYTERPEIVERFRDQITEWAMEEVR